MQALLKIAATSLALALVGGVTVNQAAFNGGGDTDTRVRTESQVGGADETGVSLDPELAGGVGSSAHIGAAVAAALDPAGAQDVSATASAHDSGHDTGTDAGGALAVGTNAPLDVDGSATLDLNAQNQEIDDAGISGGSKVGGAVKLALRAR